MKNQKTYRLTPEGKTKLEKELSDLRSSREEVLSELQRARSMGDLRENSAYQAARDKLNDTDRRIIKLELTLRNSLIVEKDQNGKIDLGSYVSLKNQTGLIEYQIVGDSEMNLKEKKISFNSPLGRALLGKKKNDTIILETPVGKTEYQITNVK